MRRLHKPGCAVLALSKGWSELCYLRPVQTRTQAEVSRYLFTYCIARSDTKLDRRMSQLEHEAEELRKRLTGNDPRRVTSPGGILNRAIDTSITPQSLGSVTPATSPSKSVDPLSTQAMPIHARPAPIVLPLPAPVQSDGVTQARTLKGTRVEAHEIDEIFQLFAIPNGLEVFASMLTWR